MQRRNSKRLSRVLNKILWWARPPRVLERELPFGQDKAQPSTWVVNQAPATTSRTCRRRGSHQSLKTPGLAKATWGNSLWPTVHRCCSKCRWQKTSTLRRSIICRLTECVSVAKTCSADWPTCKSRTVPFQLSLSSCETLRRKQRLKRLTASLSNWTRLTNSRCKTRWSLLRPWNSKSRSRWLRVVSLTSRPDPRWKRPKKAKSWQPDLSRLLTSWWWIRETRSILRCRPCSVVTANCDVFKTRLLCLLKLSWIWRHLVRFSRLKRLKKLPKLMNLTRSRSVHSDCALKSRFLKRGSSWMKQRLLSSNETLPYLLREQLTTNLARSLD